MPRADWTGKKLFIEGRELTEKLRVLGDTPALRTIDEDTVDHFNDNIEVVMHDLSEWSSRVSEHLQVKLAAAERAEEKLAAE